MTRIVYVISAVAVALFLNSPAWAGNSEEEQQIIKTVEETWKKLANKEVSDGLVGPTGTINAQSSGGLWMNLERKTFEANMKESPDTLKFSPYHINVKFLGQKKRCGLCDVLPRWKHYPRGKGRYHQLQDKGL